MLVVCRSRLDDIFLAELRYCQTVSTAFLPNMQEPARTKKSSQNTDFRAKTVICKKKILTVQRQACRWS